MKSILNLLKVSQNSSGFTLVELLVAIIILGVVSSFVISSAAKAQENARNAKRVSDVKKVQSALEQYYVDHGFYPCGAGYDGFCHPANGQHNFEESPARPDNQKLNDCTGNPNPSCNPNKLYYNWTDQDPQFPDGLGISQGHHYCYTAFDNSTNKDVCDNATSSTKCEYYEIGYTTEPDPSFPYVLNGNACNGSPPHTENNAVSPLGPVTLPATRF
jgi:prepilin-type N-terminal cleavage/methylation domain-containing protein